MTHQVLADWMPFDGDDFYGSEVVAFASLEAEAIYVRLLWYQWRKGSLPADPEALRDLLPRKAQASFEAAWRALERRFPIAGTRRENPRCRIDRLAAIGRIERKRAGAVSTNSKRQPALSDPLSDAHSATLSDPRADRLAQRIAPRERPSGSVSDSDSDPEHEQEQEPPARPPTAARGKTSSSGGTPATHAWDVGWEKVHAGQRFAWPRADLVAIADVAKFPDATPDEITRRTLCLLRSEDPWLLKRRNPRGLRDEGWNRFPKPAEVVPLVPGGELVPLPSADTVLGSITP